MLPTQFPPPSPDDVVTEQPAPRLPEARPAAPSETDDRPGRGGPAVLVAVGLVAVLMLLAAAALPILRGGDEPASESPTASPSTSLALRPQAAPVADEAGAEDVGAAEPVAAEPVEDEGTGLPPVEESVDAGVEEPVDEGVVIEEPVVEEQVAESKAVVRGGQIFLEGAVPTAEAGAEIAALAAEILGPDNVFNNYVVDPRASDPNLGNITVEDTINFNTGSTVILPESEGLLNQALALMTIRPSVTVTIVGHTDSRGSDEYNLGLSEERAASVKRWLTDRGIEGSRLTVVGKGESEPIATNETAEGQRLNRRIQFFLENLLADS